MSDLFVNVMLPACETKIFFKEMGHGFSQIRTMICTDKNHIQISVYLCQRIYALREKLELLDGITGCLYLAWGRAKTIHILEVKLLIGDSDCLKRRMLKRTVLFLDLGKKELIWDLDSSTLMGINHKGIQGNGCPIEPFGYDGLCWIYAWITHFRHSRADGNPEV